MEITMPGSFLCHSLPAAEIIQQRLSGPVSIPGLPA